jgi:ABC-2 type transport system permease protein
VSVPVAYGGARFARLGCGVSLRRIRLEQIGFWRNRQRAFFSFLMPVVLLVLLGELDHNTIYSGVRVIDWQVPGVLTFGLATAIYNNLAVAVTEQRESGILKRLRATPLPPRAFVAGQIGSSLIVGLCLTSVFVGAARALFGVSLPSGHVLAFVVTVLTGAICFAALGLAITAVIRNAESAVAVANATFIPLAVISGIFFPGQGGPPWLVSATRAMPLRSLAEALQVCFSNRAGLAFSPERLGVLLAWGAVGAICAARYFRWAPSRSVS